jgi:hypothetical protein
MSSDAEAKPAKKSKAPADAPAGGAPAAQKGEKKEKKEKGKPAEEAPAKKAPEPARPPADPRLKLLKKFRGKFLPKGVLRERHKALLQRWESGEDHGGVTVEELKALLDDWRGTREKPPRMPKA